MKTLASSTLVVCIALFTLAHDSHAHTHSLHKHNPKHNADTPVSDTASESTPNFPTSSLLTSMTPSSMAASLRRLFESEPASGHEGGELISVRYRTPALSAFDLDGGHPSSTKIEFQAFDKTFNVDLVRNDDLIPPHYKSYTWDVNENKVVEEPEFDRARRHCYYKGRESSSPGSVVAVSTCSSHTHKRQLHGLIVAHDDIFYVEPLDSHHSTSPKARSASRGPSLESYNSQSSTADHRILRLADIIPSQPQMSCGVPDHQHHHNIVNVTGGGFHTHSMEDEFRNPHLLEELLGHFRGDHHDVLSRFSRKPGERLHDSPVYSGKNPELLQVAQQNRFVELLVVNDHANFLQQGSKTNVEDKSFRLFNLVTEIYRSNPFPYTIHISLGSQVTFAEDGNPFSLVSAGGTEIQHAELLTAFNTWRRDNADELPHHDNAQLLSGEDFASQVVGYAAVKVICISWGYSSGINQVYGHADLTSAGIIAHEMGHNFGMSHDGDGNTCSRTGMIMAAIGSRDTPATAFSECSIDYAREFFDLGPVCLDNIPVITWNDQAVCGNAQIEDGEQCDCGRDNCDGIDPCCDGRSCLLNGDAECSETQACCRDCSLIKADESFVCRNISTGCDIAQEMCTGTSPNCPENTFDITGTSCDTLESFEPGLCFGGDCKEYSSGCPSDSTTTCVSVCEDSDSDGVPCGTLNGDPYQCSSNECVLSSDLYEYKWSATLWTPCSQDCAVVEGDLGEQSRNVSCTRINGSVVDEGECSGDKPSDYRTCNGFECDACRGISCNDKGDCVDGTCLCYTGLGYAGEDCSEEPAVIVTLATATNDIEFNRGETIRLDIVTEANVRELIAILKGSSDKYGTYITLPPISFTFTSEETSFQWIVDPTLANGLYRLDFIFNEDVFDDGGLFRIGCDDAKCVNGTCNEEGTACACNATYTGDLCDTPMCDVLQCRNDQPCVDGACQCNSSYSGELCDFPVDDCLDGIACQNDGVISSCNDTDFVCECNAPWGGNDCGTCSLSCVNGEATTDCTTCGCTSGYGGTFCQYEIRVNTVRLQLSEFSVFEESEEDQDRFAHLFENDVAHALSIAGERVEVVDMQAVDNLVEVTYRLYVLGDQDAAVLDAGISYQARDETRSSKLWRGLVTRHWDPQSDADACDGDDCENERPWLIYVYVLGGVVAAGCAGACIYHIMCGRSGGKYANSKNMKVVSRRFSLSRSLDRGRRRSRGPRGGGGGGGASRDPSKSRSRNPGGIAARRAVKAQYVRHRTPSNSVQRDDGQPNHYPHGGGQHMTPPRGGRRGKLSSRSEAWHLKKVQTGPPANQRLYNLDFDPKGRRKQNSKHQKDRGHDRGKRAKEQNAYWSPEDDDHEDWLPSRQRDERGEWTHLKPSDVAKAKKISRDEARRRKHLRSRSFDMTVTRRRDKHYDEVEHKKRIVDVFDQQRQQRASSDSHSRPGSRRASVSHNQEEQKEVMKSAVGIFKQRGSDVAARRRSASDQQRQLALANQKSNNNNPKNNRYRLRRMSTGSVGRDIDSLGGAGGRSAGLRGQRRRGDSNGSSPMSSLDRGETTSEGDRSPSEARLHRKVPLGEKRGSGSRSGSDDDERKSPDRRKKKLSARPQQMGKVPTSPHNNAMRSPEVASRGGGRKSPSPMLRTRDSPFFDFSDEDDADDAAANRHRRSARHRVPPRRSHQLKVNQPRTPQARKKRGKSAKLSQARSEEVTQRDSNRQHILSPSGSEKRSRGMLIDNHMSNGRQQPTPGHNHRPMRPDLHSQSVNITLLNNGIRTQGSRKALREHSLQRSRQNGNNNSSHKLPHNGHPHNGGKKVRAKDPRARVATDPSSGAPTASAPSTIGRSKTSAVDGDKAAAAGEIDGVRMSSLDMNLSSVDEEPDAAPPAYDSDDDKEVSAEPLRPRMPPSPQHARKAPNGRRLRSPSYHHPSPSASAAAARSASPQPGGSGNGGADGVGRSGSNRKLRRPRDRRQYSVDPNQVNASSSRDLRFERASSPPRDDARSDLRSQSVDVRKFNMRPKRSGMLDFNDDFGQISSLPKDRPARARSPPRRSDLPPNWIRRGSGHKRHYFNTVTGEVSYKRPTE